MPLAEAAKRRGVRVLHLNIGQPDLETPAVMRDQLRYVDRTIAYTPSGGTSDYLDFLVHYYASKGIGVEPAQLVATTGGSEALLFAFFATAAEGDEALTVEPYYTNYNSFATLAGVRLVTLRTRGEDGFHLPPRDVFEAAITERTRLILLCNPNNPTGTVYTPEELRRVAELCRERGLFLLVDEVYREFVYDGRETISALALQGFEDCVIVVDSLSKRYSACGIRLGCLVTRRPDVHQAVLRMAQGRLSPPGLAQLVALGARKLSHDYFASVVAEYQSRRDLLFEGLSRLAGVFLRKPEGAFYFVVRLPIDDADSFARFLLEEFSWKRTTVMVAPAAGFYATPGLGRDEARIAYVLERRDLELAVEVLREALLAYAGRGAERVERP